MNSYEFKIYESDNALCLGEKSIKQYNFFILARILQARVQKWRQGRVLPKFIKGRKGCRAWNIGNGRVKRLNPQKPLPCARACCNPITKQNLTNVQYVTKHEMEYYKPALTNGARRHVKKKKTKHNKCVEPLVEHHKTVNKIKHCKLRLKKLSRIL